MLTMMRVQCPQHIEDGERHTCILIIIECRKMEQSNVLLSPFLPVYFSLSPSLSL